ncbi:MAG: protein-disulfide reductase DsbD domain-containing protein [Phycisphaerales bacterium]
MGRISLLGGLVVAAAATASPLAGGSAVSLDGDVRLRLISENAALVPGQTNWLGVQFDIEKDWHLYWKGQNDSGMPIAVTATLPEGFEAGDLVWPAPKRHALEGDILDHIYETRVVLLLPVKVPAGARPGPVTLKVDAEWMVCKASCMLGDGGAELKTEVGAAGAAARPGRDAKAFAEARERVPKPPLPGALTTEWKGSTLLVTSGKGGTGPGKGRKLSFYPYEDSAPLENITRDAVSDKGMLELKLRKMGPVKGVIEISEPGSSVRPLFYVLEAAPAGSAPDPGGSR